MNNKSLKTFDWLVDRVETDKNEDETCVHIREPGLELRLERWALGDFAAIDLSYCATTSPFKVTPVDTAHDKSKRTISFQTAISGHSDGAMPSGHKFVVNKHWGLLTDYYDGSAEFIVDPAKPVKSFGGVLSIEKISQLFSEKAYQSNLTEIIDNCGIVKSYRVTPAMRMLARNAINIPLVGSLKRLYLEGAALQMFALILDQSLVQPFTGDHSSSQIVANKKAILDATERLLNDLASPPTLIELSEYSGLSMHKLNAGFKQHHGSTVIELLTKKRLQAARELLEEQPKYPLKALAQDMGYAHLSNFVTAFKREFGTPPGQYAKSFRNQS